MLLRLERVRVVALLAAAAGTVAAAGLVLLPGADAGNRPGAVVRVNQVGYPTAGPKLAYVMAGASEAGARFTVRDAAGDVVLRGHLGASRGAWSDKYPDVYRLDLSRLRTPGTYAIAVGGPLPATSGPFPIGDGSALSARPLANALSFYQNERDGPDFIPSALRTAPGHLNDEHAMTYVTPVADDNGNFQGDLTPTGVRIDASGGWWDAGDYLKFVETTSYTVDLLELGVRDFPGQMGAGAAGSSFSGEARFGVDWLARMWDDPSRTLYYQVGIGEGNDQIVGDHDIWRLPQADDTYAGSDPADRYIRDRPVFRAAPPGSPVSPNLAGRLAAAFGLCYQLERATDPAQAARCLTAGEHVFDLADTSPQGSLLTVVPYDFYPESEWRDDLELGATELARALADGPAPAGLPHADPRFYLRAAAHWAHAYIQQSGRSGDVLNLYDVSGVAHYELVRAMTDVAHHGRLEVTRRELLASLRAELDRAVVQSRRDPFGFGFPWDVWDTASHGFGLAVEASEYDALTGTGRYRQAGARWLGNVLGANAWGITLAVGDGTTSPHCLQHQVANIVGSLDGSPPVLAGGVVEGPNSFAAHGLVDGMRLCPANGIDHYRPFDSAAVFHDDMQAYSNTEPAIDLTASSPLAFSWQAVGGGAPAR